VWNRGGMRDLAGRLAEGVRYPKCSSIRLMELAAKTHADFTLAAGFHVLTQLSNLFVGWEAK
jgi:hypothetical protein